MGNDYVHILMPVPVYYLRPFTYLNPKAVKKALSFSIRDEIRGAMAPEQLEEIDRLEAAILAEAGKNR